MTNRKQSKVRPAGSSTTPTTGPPRSGPEQQPRTANQPQTGERRAARRKRVLIVAATVVVIGALVGVLIAFNGHDSGRKPSATPGSTASPGSTAPAVSGPLGPEGVPLEVGPLLAPETTAATGQTVDGIQCQASEQVAYHVHTHLSVYANGQLRPLPGGVGIVAPAGQQTAQGAFYGATQCYYWLHVHTQDGVIHIESPSARTYTLGQFFDLWGQPLTTNQVGSEMGVLTVFVDGQLFQGDPRTITLGSNVGIQIDVGMPVAQPKRIDWSNTGL